MAKGENRSLGRWRKSRRGAELTPRSSLSSASHEACQCLCSRLCMSLLHCQRIGSGRASPPAVDGEGQHPTRALSVSGRAHAALAGTLGFPRSIHLLGIRPRARVTMSEPFSLFQVYRQTSRGWLIRKVAVSLGLVCGSRGPAMR